VGEKIRAPAVGGGVHGIAGLAEGGRQLRRDPLFVFDDQNPQLTLSFRLKADATIRRVASA